MLGLTPTKHGRSGETGTPLKLGWNSGGVTQEHKKTCNISETVQDRTKVTMTD